MKAFQLLDPRQKNIIQGSVGLFRDELLKKYILCYGFSNYEAVLKEYQEFVECDSIDLPVKFEDYINAETGTFQAEDFWLQRNVQENWKYKLLANFFTNLLLIPHSNMFIESMFSHVSSIKTAKRSLLEVGSVSTIMKVKSYYFESEKLSNDDTKLPLFEPEEEHYSLYKLNIKDE